MITAETVRIHFDTVYNYVNSLDTDHLETDGEVKRAKVAISIMTGLSDDDTDELLSLMCDMTDELRS